jgi:hypothetical protein
MPVFRSKIGSWLLLLALALQFTLPFAHVHRDQSRACRATATSAPAGWVGANCHHLLAGALPAAGLSDGDAAPEAPTGLPFERCILCALTTLGSATPAPPQISPPVVVGGTRLDVRVDEPLATEPRRLFRARAPPSLA